MHKRWALRQQPGKEEIRKLAEELRIVPLLSSLLLQRGISSFDAARDFFRPQPAHLHDPFLMAGMEPAVRRIQMAIAAGEKILVYGDYDVDGTTAVALVYHFFRKRYPLIDYYIPDRYREGYGISEEGIAHAAANGFSLVIALDCGIKSVERIAAAHEQGISFIVCDHHLPGPVLPPAAAVLDPKRADCRYPFKELSGCGIGFKLIQAFALREGIDFAAISPYLDLVAVSIACDIVPVTGENRVLAHLGLKQLNQAPCIGRKALIGVAGRGGSYTLSNIVFQLGPRINAAGRVSDARHVVELLTCTEEDGATLKSLLIDGHNNERKSHDLSITEQALDMIAGDSALQNRKTTVLFHEQWHKGVIGIVASRLTEKYYRPTVVLTRSNGHLAGSARSVSGFDLYEALDACRHLLLQFGGHKYAAGLTLDPANLEAFSARFEEVVQATITNEQLVQEIRIDTELELKEIDSRFYRILSQFEPFGPENPAPVFLTKNVQVCHFSAAGSDQHLKLRVRQPGSADFDCIAFGQGAATELIRTHEWIDICYTLEENRWRERSSLQLNIKGIRPAESQTAAGNDAGRLMKEEQ